MNSFYLRAFAITVTWLCIMFHPRLSFADKALGTSLLMLSVILFI